MDSRFFAAAVQLVRKHGYLEARRLCEQWRDASSPGTTTYALHNAVLKQLERAATAGKLEAASTDIGDSH